MKLWIIKPKPEILSIEDENLNPWEPWYDKVFGTVIRAETETEARAIAFLNVSDEKYTIKGANPWDEKYSTCVELLPTGDAGLVIRDHHGS